jgi:hypothetical protein
MMGMLDEDQVLVLQKLQAICEKKAIALEESHNPLCTEVIDLQNVIPQLQTKNQRLRIELEITHSQLEDEDYLFQTKIIQ